MHYIFSDCHVLCVNIEISIYWVLSVSQEFGNFSPASYYLIFTTAQESQNCLHNKLNHPKW